MENLSATWNRLDSRRRVIVILATIGVFFAVLFLSRTASTPSLSLLYAGLDQAAAAEVVTALDQSGVAYDVRGTAIYVDSAQRDSTRLALASEGLPSTAGAGYELLDSLSGFGTTAQMFDAAYWRAKEGELARTIIASPQFKAARVHISNSVASGFTRAPDASASVFVTPSNGSVASEQAKALRFLVASAVTGLEPDRVSVIDSVSGAVISIDDGPGGRGSEADVSARLRQNVQRLLEARVGPGNAVVEVSVQTGTDTESIIERRFDPEGRVAVSTVTEETSGNSQGALNGAVTVASNLPDGQANGEAGSSSTQNSETREQVNFEVSETQREIVRGPGAIERLSVAVLVNGTRGTGPNGEDIWEPRGDDELSDLRDLVASAVGFNADRGDEITLRSMAFESVPEVGTSATLSLFDQYGIDLMHLISMAVLGAVALALGLFVVRPILTAPPPPPALPPVAEAEPEPVDLGGALSGEIDSGDLDIPQMAVVSDFDSGDGGLPDIGMSLGGGDSSDPVARLKQMIETRQDETVEILQDWMKSPQERA